MWTFENRFYSLTEKFLPGAMFILLNKPLCKKPQQVWHISMQLHVLDLCS